VDHGATAVRLFVWNGVSAKKHGQVYVTGKYRDIQCSRFFLTSDQMEIISSIEEGTIYSIPLGGKVIDAHSLRARTLTSGAEIDYKDGFYPTERFGKATWRWARDEAWIDLNNCTNRTAAFELSLSLAALVDSTVTIEGVTISERVPVGEKDVCRTWKVTVPPGAHEIHFSSDSRFVHAPNESGEFAFRVMNVSVTDITNDNGVPP
jgi:hypothetical protein